MTENIWKRSEFEFPYSNTQENQLQSGRSKIKSNKFSILFDQLLSSFPLLLTDLDMTYGNESGFDKKNIVFLMRNLFISKLECLESGENHPVTSRYKFKKTLKSWN